MSKGIDFGAGELRQFIDVRELVGWKAYQAGIDALDMPTGSVKVFASYTDANFVPEGIALD